MTFDADAVRHAYEDLAGGYATRFGEDLERTSLDRAVLDSAIAMVGAPALVLDRPPR